MAQLKTDGTKQATERGSTSVDVVVEMVPGAANTPETSSVVVPANSAKPSPSEAHTPPPPAKEQSAGYDIYRQCVAEFTGTAMLVCTIIGSGIMGDALSADDGVALLGNTLATWGILFVLITVLGPVSGAHFNPVVSMCFYLKKEICGLKLLAFMIVQFAGGILGAVMAHGMFEIGGYFHGKARDTVGEFFSETVATFGLLLVIFGAIGVNQKSQIPMAVGLYITAGYWFTSSTAFANPAVTVARSFTNSFASIAPSSFGHYFAGQALGLVLTLPFTEWLFLNKSFVQALKTLIRR